MKGAVSLHKHFIPKHLERLLTKVEWCLNVFLSGVVIGNKNKNWMIAPFGNAQDGLFPRQMVRVCTTHNWNMRVNVYGVVY